MEELVEDLERLREVERLRVLGLLYVVWIPFVAFSGYLMLFIERPWYVFPSVALIGLIPYAWVIRKMSFEDENNREGFVLGIIFAAALQLVLSTVSLVLSVAGAIGGWLIAVSYYLKKNRVSTWYLDALASMTIIALTAASSGLSFMKQWIALTLSVTIAYSAVAAIRASFGIHEVLPFVRKGGKR